MSKQKMNLQQKQNPEQLIPISNIAINHEIYNPAHDLIIDATQHNAAIRLAKGTYQKLRRVITAPLIAFFILAPWLTMNGNPLVQMDLATRQLFIFGLNVWPDDLIILIWVAMASAFALFAVANFAGRLWCGFTCPQTVWSMMFVWVEEKIEGSRNQRLKQKQNAGSVNARIKSLVKHIIWLGLAFVTGFSFVAYFETGPALFQSMLDASIGLDVVFWLVFFTSLTYINAGWLREQVCLHMCPYARFQSVMIDDKSLKVSYDLKRGEPRKNNHAEQVTNEKSGDCIDCKLCVQVCPVGIDIRQGMQYACIDCGACIDACDDIMAKIHKPKGLIRFSNETTQHWSELFKNRSRLKGYGALTILCCIGFFYQVNSLETFEASINRDRTQLYLYDLNGSVTNPYSIKLHNKTMKDSTYDLEILGKYNQILNASLTDDLRVSATDMRSQNLMISCLQPCELPYRNQVEIKVSNESQNKTLDLVFFNPK